MVVHKYSSEIQELTSHFLTRGRLPLAYFSKSDSKALQKVKLVAERGITQTYDTTIAVDDEVRQCLAQASGQEFTYQGAFQKLRTQKRQVVNNVIDHLMNHGYLFKKRPFLGSFEMKKSTYFAVYSWIDPGLIDYYSLRKEPNATEQGFRLESAVHALITSYVERMPAKANVYYYKPFAHREINDSLLFEAGEIDLIFQIGDRVIPIEEKLGKDYRSFDLTTLKSFIHQYKVPYGIVLYGGSAFIDDDQKLIFYPYWQI